jgi:hypothetical protein
MFMISGAEIEKLVREKIACKEELGEQAGGSGHLGYVDYQLDSIGEPVLTEAGYRVDYRYTRIIVTEFTYEPDNPPYRYPVESYLIIDPEIFMK